MELDEIRDEIDRHDSVIVTEIVERMKLIPLVAEYKEKHNIAVYQPEREEQILMSRREQAEKLGGNPDLVEAIVKIMIDYAHKIENDYLKGVRK